MTDMKSINLHCLLRDGSPFEERTSSNSRPIDSRTTQAFHQLRLHAEELALELAVRLRVLGKSLASACPGHGAGDGKRTKGAIAYTKLRRQLDGFFGSLESRDFAGDRYYPVIRHYLQDALPGELEDRVCTDPCRIELVDAVISLLTENVFEGDGSTEGPAIFYSL